VFKGNICRSAYAEAVARSLGVDAVSCGVDTQNGLPANDEAIKTAATKGFDLSTHKTTAIQSLVLRSTDLFVAMEPWQVERIGREFGNECNCSLLGLWGVPANPHIQDPYGASTFYFINCFNYIEDSVNEIAKKIKAAGSY
jgi:protein-tyrosine phosphatase